MGLIISSNRGAETFEYKEEEKDSYIEISLKLKLDKNYKSVQNYIENCKGKQCLATKTIKVINSSIKL